MTNNTFCEAYEICILEGTSLRPGKTDLDESQTSRLYLASLDEGNDEDSFEAMQRYRTPRRE
ncbi:MAG: hypothetical protein AABW51_02430 [Nanoarchaeota archaeon]